MELAEVKEEAKRAAFAVARGVRDLGRAFDADTAATTINSEVVAEAVKAAREGVQGLVRTTIAVRNHHNAITATTQLQPDRERRVKEAEEQAQKVAGAALRLATAAPRVAALASLDARREAAAAVDRVRTQLFEDVKALLGLLLALLPQQQSEEGGGDVAGALASSSSSSIMSSSSSATPARQLQLQEEEEEGQRKKKLKEKEEKEKEEEVERRRKKVEEAERVDREIKEMKRMKEKEEEEKRKKEAEAQMKEKEEKDRKAKEAKEEQEKQKEEDAKRRQRQQELKEKEELEKKKKAIEEQERKAKEDKEREQRFKREKEEEEERERKANEEKEKKEKEERERKANEEKERRRREQDEQELECQERQREQQQQQLELEQQQKLKQQQQQQQQPKPPQEEKKELTKPKAAAVVSGPEIKVIAVATFRPEFDDELAFVEDDVFTVFAAVAEDASIWWGRHRGKEGIFPSECVDVLQGDPDKLALKSVEEEDAEADADNSAHQPTDADSFVPLALLLPTTEVGEGEVQVRAVSDYKGASDDELSFVRDDVFPVTAVLRDDDLYLWGKLRGRVGYFPRRCVVVTAGDVALLPERAIEEEELRRQQEKLQRKLEAMEKQRQRQEDELKSAKRGPARDEDDDTKKVTVDREQRVGCKTCESEVVIRKGVMFGICEECGALVQREWREEDAEALKLQAAQREADEAAHRAREEETRKLKREEFEKKREDDEKRKREEWERKKHEEEEERKRQVAATPPHATTVADDVIVTYADQADADADSQAQPEEKTKEKARKSAREKEGSYIFGGHRVDAAPPKVKFVQDKQLVTKSPPPSPSTSSMTTVVGSLASSASTPSASSAHAAPAKWGSTIVPPTTYGSEPTMKSASPRSPRASDSASSSSSGSPASSTSSTPLASPRGNAADDQPKKAKTKKEAKTKNEAKAKKEKKTKKQRSGTLKRLGKKDKKNESEKVADNKEANNKTKTEATKKKKTKKTKKTKERELTEREIEMARELAELKQQLLDVQTRLAQKEEEERRRLNERRQSVALTAAATAAYGSSSSLPQVADVAADPRKLPSTSQPPKLGRRESLLHLKQMRESQQQQQEGSGVGAGAGAGGGGGAWGKHTLRKIDGLQRTGSGRYITSDEDADEAARKQEALRRGIVL